MAVVALNGYHSVAKYQWSLEARVLDDETTPLVYTSVAGKYLCVVTAGDNQQRVHFNVTGN